MAKQWKRGATWAPAELRAVRDILVRLYPNPSGVRRVLFDLGLDDGGFDLAGPIVDVWLGVLMRLSQQDGPVERVLDYALEEYPANPALKNYTVPQLVPPVTSSPSPSASPQTAVSASNDVSWQIKPVASGSFTRLSGDQYRALQEALLDAFPTPGGLQQFVQFRLEQNLAAITATSSLSQDVFNLIQWAQARGITEHLYRSARAERPDNASLAAFGLRVQAPEAGQAPEPVTSGSALEEILRRDVPTLRLADLLRTLGLIRGRVCRIDVGGVAAGTGFLVGPAAVLTNCHVVYDVIEGRAAPTDVVLRFDLEDGSDGTEVRLADPWLIDHSPYAPFEKTAPDSALPTPEQLDYAVLRTRGRPGESVIGRGASPTAAKRGFIDLPASLPRLRRETPLFIVQHPDGRPQEIAFETRGVIEYNGNATRMKHRVNTEHGASGSPVFDFHGKLVALHHAGDPRVLPVFNQAVPIDKVRDLLDRHGKLSALGA